MCGGSGLATRRRGPPVRVKGAKRRTLQLGPPSAPHTEPAAGGESNAPTEEWGFAVAGRGLFFENAEGRGRGRGRGRRKQARQ